MSKHLVVIGDARDMRELSDESVQLVVTSPPYYNVKDYGAVNGNVGGVDDYNEYLQSMEEVLKECKRVLQTGRYLCVNVCDVISDGKKYALAHHYVSLLEKLGFEYRDDIIWKKPKGTGANSSGGAGKRFGNFIQHPYPLYYFPNNVYEHVLVFRKGKTDYKQIKKTRELDMESVKANRSTDIWEIHPETKNQYSGETHPAMFPEELPREIIELYSYPGETILDPFLGSGTTMKVAKELNRNCVGYEINPDYLRIIRRKVGFYPNYPADDKFVIKFKRRLEK